MSMKLGPQIAIIQNTMVSIVSMIVPVMSDSKVCLDSLDCQEKAVVRRKLHRDRVDQRLWQEPARSPDCGRRSARRAYAIRGVNAAQFNRPRPCD